MFITAVFKFALINIFKNSVASGSSQSNLINYNYNFKAQSL